MITNNKFCRSRAIVALCTPIAVFLIVVGGQLSDAGATNLMAVGEFFRLLRSTDSGLTWNQQPSPTTRTLVDVEFVDSNHGWAIGNYNGASSSTGILRTTDGGATWSVQNAPQGNIFDIEFSDVNNGWGVGEYGGVIQTTDGGVTWNILPSPTSQVLFGLAIISDPTAELTTFPGDGETLEFGKVRIGGAATMAIAVQNTGDTGSQLSGELPGASGEFGPARTQAYGPLGAGGSTSRDYTYTPIDHTMDNQDIIVTSNNGNSLISLSGTGVGPIFSSDTTPGGILDFGIIPANSTSIVSLEISNTTTDDNMGDAQLTDLSILDVTITGTDASKFSADLGLIGTTIGMGDMDLLDLTFNSNGMIGVFNATLTIETDEDAPLQGDGNDYTYTLTIFVAIPRDFDFDGHVDGLDFLKWQRGLGTIYDATDLADWEANYGAPLTATSTAVPEPATGIMLLFAMMAMLFRRDVVVS